MDTFTSCQSIGWYEVKFAVTSTFGDDSVDYLETSFVVYIGECHPGSGYRNGACQECLAGFFMVSHASHTH